MTLTSLLRQNPRRRISPFDGMTVTADVWQEAHEYHHFQQRMHALNGHGVGILAGLEVIAAEPAGQTVYILPGAAIDPGGNLIVVEQPAAYDMGRYRDGSLHLLLSYSETRPQPANGQYGDRPFFVYTGYSVETIGDRPDSPQVELARIVRQGQDQPITNAADFHRPGFNEIDLRFRPEVAPLARATLLTGVAYLSPLDDPSHSRGVSRLARSVSMQPEMRVLVNDRVDLRGDLGEYTLLCLVARREFAVDDGVLAALRGFVEGGGTLFIESCHREGGERPGADGSFDTLLRGLGIAPRAAKRHDPILSEPFFFAQPPEGFENQGAPGLRVADGVVVSGLDYGCIWQGDRRNGNATREEIRAAMEWGHNLLLYAWQRRTAGGRR